MMKDFWFMWKKVSGKSLEAPEFNGIPPT